MTADDLVFDTASYKPRLNASVLFLAQIEKKQEWAAKSICVWYSPAFRSGCWKVSLQSISFQIAA